MKYLKNKFYIKSKNNDEFNIVEKYPSLKYLDGKSYPVFNNNYQGFSGKDGNTFINSSFDKSVFIANFYLRSVDYRDFILTRHDLYNEFSDRGLIRIRTGEDINKIMFVRPNNFEINFIGDGNFDSLFSIQFDIPSGYKYSLSRSDAVTIDDISFGMNFHLDEKPTYTQTANSFRIFNPSDIAVDPYYQRHDLMLMIKFAGSSYQITNTTNGSSYKYTNASNGADNIVLNGLSTILNGKPASQNTDFGFIKLEKGWNDIMVQGATSHTTTFSFPFIYID